MTELRAIRGHDQKGLCFVTSSFALKTRFAEISTPETSLICEVRMSEKVPEDLVVVDNHLFEYLGLEDESVVTLLPVDIQIPLCSEIVLAISSTKGLDNQKVSEAIAKRIDDLERYFEGIILQTGQVITVKDLSVEFTVVRVSPVEESTMSARIAWRNLLKVELRPKTVLPCFNLCFVIDVGAAMKKEDVQKSSGDGYLSRIEVAKQILSELLGHLMSCESETVFAAVAYSDVLDILTTYDPDSGEEITISTISSPSIIKHVENWLISCFSTESTRPSSPGTALERALSIGYSMLDRNPVPTVLLLISGGAYSAGPNPVSFARLDSDAPEKLAVHSIGLGRDADSELLEAIARAGHGKFVRIDKVEDVLEISKVLGHWLKSSGEHND